MNKLKTNIGKIIITLTSFKLRINQVIFVIKNLLEQTIKADLIYLNLSIEEFPNREMDLPKDLVELSIKEPTFIINWVKGKNTKSFKKLLPILQYLNEDDIIFYTDDDILFKENVLENRINQFINNDNNFVIASPWKASKYYKYAKSGPGSLIKKSFLNNYELFFDDYVINSGHDDNFYETIYFLNGIYSIRCENYFSWTTIDMSLEDNIGECGIINNDNINSKRTNIMHYGPSEGIFKKLLEIFNLNDYMQLFGILNNPKNINIIKEKY